MKIFSDPIIFLLMEAIVIVESGGSVDAVGFHGEVGPMQITQAAIADVNALGAKQFTIEDAKGLEKSKNIFWLYCHKWATHERIDREATCEDLARIWNGGPDGYKKDSTREYWRKVKEQMQLLMLVQTKAP